MARRSTLETRFTGDDRQFQKVASRVEVAGKRAANMWGSFSKVFIGGAVATGIGRIAGSADRIGKLAERFDISAESLQRLSFVAEQSGSNMTQLQAILTRLGRRTGEALLDPMSSAAKAFRELNINVEKLSKLSPEEKLKAISDAWIATGKSDRGLATLMRLLDTEVRELIPLLNRGSAEITQMGDSIQVMSNKSIAEMVKMNDSLNRLKISGTALLVNVLAPMADALDRVAVKLGQINNKKDILQFGRGELFESMNKVLAGPEAEKVALSGIGSAFSGHFGRMVEIALNVADESVRTAGLTHKFRRHGPPPGDEFFRSFGGDDSRPDFATGEARRMELRRGNISQGVGPGLSAAQRSLLGGRQTNTIQSQTLSAMQEQVKISEAQKVAVEASLRLFQTALSVN